MICSACQSRAWSTDTDGSRLMPSASVATKVGTGSSACWTMSMMVFQQTARASGSVSPPTDSVTIRSERGSNLTMT